MCDHIEKKRDDNKIMCGHIEKKRDDNKMCDHIEKQRDDNNIMCDHIEKKREDNKIMCAHIKKKRDQTWTADLLFSFVLEKNHIFPVKTLILEITFELNYVVFGECQWVVNLFQFG